MAKTLTGIPETKGFFQMKGKVIGVGKENFYKEGKTRKGNAYRRISFGIQVSATETFFVEIFGNIMENVYFSKRDKDGNFDTKKVAWKDRNKFKKDGYSLIGQNLGLTKTEDENGKSVNDKKYMVDFDGCEYINEHLEDGMSVFVKGKIQYGHYTDDSGELIRTQKFIPQQISLCREVDFDVDNYEAISKFTQTIVFMEVEKEEKKEGNESDEDRFLVSANIPTYNGVEFTEFVVNSPKLAKKFKAKLKSYNSIEVHGNIVSVSSSKTVDEKEDDGDGWGEENEMKKAYTSYRKELVITGAEPKSVDDETYTKKNVTKAIEGMNKEEKIDSKFDDNKKEDWDDEEDSEEEGW